MKTLDTWARFATVRRPIADEYLGLSYEQASRRAEAVCRAAAENGRTINASYHLDELRAIMQMCAKAAA